MIVNLTPHALLFTIAAIGISEASYLIRKRIAAESPVCPIDGGCEIVLKSKYNKIFGIHNDLLGLLFYIVTAMITGLVVIYENYPDLQSILVLILKFMLMGATAMSAIFFYLQWKVIKAWCFWCLMSALTIVIMDIIVFSI